MKGEMSALVRAYIQGRAEARLEKLDKEAEKQKKEAAADVLTLAEIAGNHTAKRAEEAAKYQPCAWLSGAAARAKQISFATHPAKFTHTDAKGSSVYAAKRDAIPDAHYLTTVDLAAPDIDVDGNAAALDVAGFLQLTVNGISLASMIAQNDMSALQTFAENDAQLDEWRLGFQQALADKDICSHTLSKQLYIPVAKNAYHIVSPLFASSLTQALYQRIADSRFTDAAKEARKLKREGKFSTAVTVDFFNVAVQTFGGTKPQNVSQLNSRRGGKTFLLSCQPPTWTERLLPSLTQKDAFWQAYGRQYNGLAWRTAKSLKNFLSSITEKDSTKPRRDQRADLVDELIDLLLQYAAEVRGMTEHAGWTAQSQLSRAEQLWLDPLRQDAQFQSERGTFDWQQEIANQFAGWLNRQLQDDKLVMKDVEYREWSKLLRKKLALLKEELVFVLKDDQEDLAA
jgi:CRISPR-associated protein Csy1